MNLNIIEYRPKGGMCANCTKIKNDCSDLDFAKMDVIAEEHYFRRVVNIVRCCEFERKTKAVA